MGIRKESSTNMVNEKYITEECDLTYSVCKVGGRWKLLILCKLENGKLRFGEIKKQISGITERMLALQLRELEKDGLVIRTVHPVVPPKVEYELTSIANDLIPIWAQLSNWGARHRKFLSEQHIL